MPHPYPPTVTDAMERLRELVRLDGRTQVALAREMGWTPSQLSRFLTGDRPKVPLEAIAKVLAVLELNWNALVRWPPKPARRRVDAWDRIADAADLD